MLLQKLARLADAGLNGFGFIQTRHENREFCRHIEMLIRSQIGDAAWHGWSGYLNTLAYDAWLRSADRREAAHLSINYHAMPRTVIGSRLKETHS
jgi:hypothetical protein